MADDQLDDGSMVGGGGLDTSVDQSQQQAPPQAIAQSLMAGMGNGMGPNIPQQPSAGVQAVRKHGGLLTGLVGVLLDGLSAGVRTPQGPQGFSQAANMAAQMPQQRAQQQLNFSTQQEMAKAQIAQAHVQQLQTRLLMATLDDEVQSGMSDAAWKFATKSVEQGTAKMVSGIGSREAAADKLKELHDTGEASTRGNLFMYPASKSQGDGTSEWAVYQVFPEGTFQEDFDIPLPGSTDGKVPAQTVHIKAGQSMKAGLLDATLQGRNQGTLVHSNTQENIAANKNDPTKTVPRVVGGKDHTILVNARTGEDIKDLGEAPAKPQAPKPEKAEDMAIGTIKVGDSSRQVAGTMAELNAAGAKGMTKAGAAEAEKIQNARSLINVFDSKDPDDPGLVQIAADLDKKGKLGPAAASFAEWLNKGKTLANFNAGDDEVQRLFTKMGLATTGLMQVHVGAKGSAQMLEHFEDLAKAKEMSSSAFRTALDTESRYVRMKAMRPDDVKARFGRDMKTAERNKVALTDLPQAQ